MMVKDITHYGKRNKIEREPNGRVRRNGPREFMAYIVQQEGSNRIKVGYTQNAPSRMTSYETLSGVPVRFLAQMVVSSRQEARALEAHILDIFSARYDKFRREWFLLDGESIRSALFEAIVTAPVHITDLRGIVADRPKERVDYYSSGALVHNEYI